MSTHPPPQPVTDYVAALIQSSAQIGSIIAQMERFASRSGVPRTRPSVAILSELIEGILADPEAGVDLSAVERSTRLLVEATVAIGENLYFVDVDDLADGVA